LAKKKFPHFTLEEAEVAELFEKIGPLKGKWQYEVRLTSKKARWVENEPEWIKKMWEKITAKRIDMVCERESDVNLVEVKRYLLPSGIGQLLLYAHMYNEQFKPQKPVKLWYVAYYGDPDVEEFAKSIGINVWVLNR